MKSTNSARGTRSVWPRVAGYGGAVLLAVAAVVVLLLPLVGGEKGGADAAGAKSPAGASGAPTGGLGTVQGQPGTVSTPSGPTRRQERSRTPVPQQQGGGPQMPGQNGSGTGLTWCPQGTAYYRAARNGIDVVINVAASGAVRAEVTARGSAPAQQQATVRSGRAHTFRFNGVAPSLVRQVKIMTLSVGGSMDTCYARPAA